MHIPRRSIRRLVAVLSLALAFIPAQTTLGEEVEKVAVQSYNPKVFPAPYYWRGVAGLAYVYDEPTGFQGTQLSSVYVAKDSVNYAEVGLVRDYPRTGDTAPRLFWAYETSFTGKQQNGLIQTMDVGRWYNLQLYNAASGSTGTWKFGHDNEVKREFSLPFAYGVAMSSAERDPSNTRWNAASFSQLQMKDNNGNWFLWSTHNSFDDDQYWNYGSNGQHYRWWTWQ